MRGRKPVPTHLKIIRGNPGKRKLNSSEPIPVGALAAPPDWMSRTQKAGWRYAIRHAPPGLLKKLDRSVMAAWVVAEDLHRQAAEQVEKFGILTKSITGQSMQSPFLPVVNKQAAIMMKAAEQLGFSPVSRSRIHLMDSVGGQTDDEWGRIDSMRTSGVT